MSHDERIPLQYMCLFHTLVNNDNNNNNININKTKIGDMCCCCRQCCVATQWFQMKQLINDDIDPS